MIIRIRHYGISFESDENALLIASGLYHHIVFEDMVGKLADKLRQVSV